jgi:hypothetical protein
VTKLALVANRRAGVIVVLAFWNAVAHHDGRHSCDASEVRRLRSVLTWLSAFDDPGPGAVPPVIFAASRAVHKHFDFWKCIKYHATGVEPGGDGLAGYRTSNEDVASDAVLG